MDSSLDFSYQQVLNLVKHLTLEQKKKLFDLLQPDISKKSGNRRNSSFKRKAGSMKGLITKMDKDFDAPLDDFKEYMQ